MSVIYCDYCGTQHDTDFIEMDTVAGYLEYEGDAKLKASVEADKTICLDDHVCPALWEGIFTEHEGTL